MGTVLLDCNFAASAGNRRAEDWDGTTKDVARRRAATEETTSLHNAAVVDDPFVGRGGGRATSAFGDPRFTGCPIRKLQKNVTMSSGAVKE